MLAQTHRFHGLSALRPLYKSGSVIRGKSLAVRYQARKDETYRAAVVVSKKVHKSAVVRNRIRRRIYEVIRLADPSKTSGLDIAVMVYSTDFAGMPYDTLKTELTNLLSKAHSSLKQHNKHAIVEKEE